MFFKETARLVLLAVPVACAGQQPPLPPAGSGSPANPLNLPVSRQSVLPSSHPFIPLSLPARPHTLPVLPSPAVLRREQTPSAGTEQIAQTSVTPNRAPQSPDTVSIVPTASPAPGAGSGPVVVDFRDGKLTVSARNSELGTLLRLIGKKTGAEIDFAPEIAGDPVVAQLGPGSPSEVLTELLTGPDLDFILLGSDEQGQVQSVVVRRRASFGQEPIASLPAGRRQDQVNPAQAPELREPGRQEQETQSQQPPPQENPR